MNRDPGVPPSRDALDRATAGALYGLGAALLTWTLAGTRLVLLMRLLPPEVFGFATQSLILVGAAIQLLTPGLNEAILQRPNVGAVELTTYRRLKLGWDLCLLAALATLVLGLTSTLSSVGLSAVVLWGYLGAEALRALQTPTTVQHMRALDYRRLRAADVAASAAMTIVAPALAALGFGIWALVAEPAAAQLARLAVLAHSPSRVPAARFDRRVAAELLRFGRTVWGATNLGYFLDHFDDFWTGRALGRSALGFYSRGFEIATFPRRIGVQPALAVLLPLASRLQSDPAALGRALRVILALLVRINLAFALPLAVAADELVPWVFGEAWRPMVPAVRVLLLFLLFDPPARVAAELLIAIGEPGVVLRIRLAQAALLVPAVVIGARAGILGVAVATSLVASIGAIWLLVRARRSTGATLRGVWLWPLVAAGLAAGLAAGVVSIVFSPPFGSAVEPGSDAPLSALGRAAVALVVFAALLWWRERTSTYDAAKRLLGALRAERQRVE